MLRNILASTAIIALVSGGAIAETATPKLNMSGEEASASGIYEFETNTLAEEAAKGFLASNMIGEAVMTGEGENAEEIGDINDILVDRDGAVRAVVIGVGGFVGIGEKEVAVEFERLSFVSTNEEQLRVVSDLSKEELEAAPEYERPDYIPNWMSTAAVRDGMNNAGETMGAAADKAKEKMGETADAVSNRVQEDVVKPVGEQMDRMADADWTAEKTQIDAATVSTDVLIGASVYTAADTDIGEVSEVLLGKDGKAEAVVIDVGGFLGFGEKPVAVSYDSLKMYENENGSLLVTAEFTEEELKNAAEYAPAEYKENPDNVLLKG